MSVWNIYKNKKVFLISKHNKNPIIGKVVNIEQNEGSSLVWITMIDKYGKQMIIVNTEILEIKEED